MEEFNELRKQATDAFRWQSMNPEGMASSFIGAYERMYNDDLALFYLEQVSDEDVKRYTNTFFNKLRDIIASEGRCASAMVTGPAKFDFERNRKRIDAAMNKRKEFDEWRDKAIKAIMRRKSKEAGIDSDVEETMKYVKEMTEHKQWYSAQYLTTYLERKAVNGKVESVKAAIDYLIDLRVKKDGSTYRESEVEEELRKESKPFLTQKSKVWGMLQVAVEHAAKQQERAQKENLVFEHGYYKIVINYAEDRLQIIFDEKPDRHQISCLKFECFHWSPKNKAWQRQLTERALIAVHALGYHDNLCNEVKL